MTVCRCWFVPSNLLGFSSSWLWRCCSDEQFGALQRVLAGNCTHFRARTCVQQLSLWTPLQLLPKRNTANQTKPAAALCTGSPSDKHRSQQQRGSSRAAHCEGTRAWRAARGTPALWGACA